LKARLTTKIKEDMNKLAFKKEKEKRKNVHIK
jgi:hypothetical protein